MKTYSQQFHIPTNIPDERQKWYREELLRSAGINLVKQLEIGKYYTICLKERTERVLEPWMRYPEDKVTLYFEIGEVEIVPHVPYRMATYEEMPSLLLSHTAMEEIKQRIKSKLARIKFEIWKATRR